MSRQLAARFLRLIRPWLARIAGGALASALCGAVYILVPIALRNVIDALAHGDGAAKTRAVEAGVAVIVAIALGQAICSYFQSMLLASVNAGMTRELRRRLIEHVLRLPLRVSGAERVGVFLGRYSADIPVIQALATTTIPSLLRNAAIVIGLIAVLFVMSWKLTIVTAVVITVVGFASQHFVRRTAGLSRPLQTVRSEALALLGEMITNVALIRAFGRQATIVARMNERLDLAYDLSLRAARVSALSRSVVNIVGGLLLCTILWLGASNALTSHVELATMMGYLTASGMLAAALGTVAGSAGSVATSVASLERYLDLLDVETDVDDQLGRTPPVLGALSFENVSFRYRGDTAVLHDVTLDIPAGTSLAIVGPSGSGKSTILQLVLAAFTAQSGRILLDDHPLDTISTSWLRERIGYVPQEPYVFHGTIAENLRFGKPDASDAELHEACRVARFDRVVARCATGLDAVVGERGTTLSRGEAQRLAIARMVLRDPAIVLLDEATASLDAENERLVLEALDESLRGRTTISVTHRLENAMRCDRVAILYEGRLVERGSPADLLRRGGMFARLVAATTFANETALSRIAPLTVSLL